MENSESNSNKILASQFINRVGLNNLVNFYNTSAQNANFLNWVLNNSTAMEEFLSGPNPDGAHEPEGQPPATYEQCLQVWSNIWNTYTNSHSGFNLRLAIAVALTNGQPIPAFPNYLKTVGSPVVRYNIFESLNAQGGMMPGFDKFDVSHLCYIVNTDIANDQIEEARSIILQNHNGLLTPASINALAYTINYNSRNPYTGVSVFNYPNFYGPNPTIKDVWYDGGVCGATGRMGAACEQIFGVPAVQTPQTGHNAFIYYDSLNNTWQIGNMVDGWNDTYDADMSSWSDILAPNDNMIASYTELYQAADNGTLQKSNMYLYLASVQTNYSDKLNSIKEAMKIDNLNMGAWIALVNLYNSNPSITMEQYNQLATQAQSIFKDYNMPMTNLVHYIYSNILQEAISEASLSSNSANLKSQIANANSILQNVNASQSDILSAIKSLEYKNLNLQKEIDSLKAKIVEGQKDLNEKIYTTNSVNTLEKAIKLAQNTVNLSNPTMIDVLNSLKNINNAIDGLQMIPLNVNEVFANQNKVTGKAAPNSTVIMTFNGKKYTVKADDKGNFEINNLPEFNSNEKFNIYSQEGNLKTIIQEIQVNGLDSYTLTINNVWHYNMAFLGFNTEKKELKVEKEWAISNPYLPTNSEAFSISLLNSNKNPIKSVTINGNAKTGNLVYNALNGVNFAYGDYLDVDFKTSSNLSLNYVIENGKIEDNYKIKSNELFKFTPNGLELVTNNSSSTNSNNKNNTTSNKNNEPEKNSNNTTNNKNNEPKKNSSVDNAQLENQLKLDIASANRMMDNSGYTLGSKNVLGEAINAGNTILANKNATSDEITNAINSLISAYKGLVVDTVGLKNDVKEAQTLVNSGNYTKESELSLENAIKAGENLLASKEINVFSVENVINQLNSAAKSLVVQKKEAAQKVEIENNAQTFYFANISGVQSLVINGNIDGIDTPANVSKELIIESSNGQVIDTINTTPVNWYSKNKENYSGYQGIISGNILSKLEVGENYKVGIKYDGQVHMLNSKVTMPSYGQYRVENSNGDVVIQKSSVIQEGVANCEMGYVYNNGFIINANVNLNGDVIPASAQKQIVITDENGKVVYESNTIPVNWYSSNKNDYSGLQAYIPQSELSKLNVTGNYKISILVTEGSKKYSIPVKGFVNASTDGYKLYNNGDILSITKAQNVTASAKIENKYQDGNSTVINAMMNIENVPTGSSAMLKVTEKDGTVKEVNGVLVNWYSKDKNNLNGVQFVVNSKIIENAKSSAIVVSVGNKNYNCNL